MRPFGSPSLVEEVLLTAASYDPVSSRYGREGLDRHTIDCMVELVSHPDVGNWFTSLARTDLTEDHIVGVLRRLRLVIDKKLSLSMVAFELQTGSCVGARAQTPRPVRTMGRVRPARRGTRTA